MVAKKWTLDDAQRHLKDVLDRAATDGPQTVVDDNGNTFEVCAEEPRDEEQSSELTLTQRLTCHLPPGEPIDADANRHEYGSQRRRPLFDEVRDMTDDEFARTYGPRAADEREAAADW